MVIKKKSNKKFPLYVYPAKGHPFSVPSQHNFKTKFVDEHGCSLVAFYIAMSFIGKKKKVLWLLKWSKKHLKVKSKIPLVEVYSGLKKLAPKNKRDGITYRKEISAQELRSYLARGYLVLLETKDPIHTNPLMWDDTKSCVRNFSYGGKKKVTVSDMVKKQSKNSTYRGCVIIRP